MGELPSHPADIPVRRRAGTRPRVRSAREPITEGLIIPGRGNPLPMLSASVACNGMIVASSRAVPFSPAGDARIKTKVKLPARCLAPAVLLNPTLP